MVNKVTFFFISRSGRDKVLIFWDLSTFSQLRIIPTYECTESLIPIEFGKLVPHLNVTDVKSPHVITAGEKGNNKCSNPVFIERMRLLSYYLGCLRVWNVKSGIEVFTQTDSLVTQPIVEGAPTITQLEYNETNDHLYVITFDHNIIVHQRKDLALVKQVNVITKLVLFKLMHSNTNSTQDTTMIF